MSTKTVATEVASETKEKEVVKRPKRKTITNWQVLKLGGFVPVRVKCTAYRAPFPADQSCNSNILADGENIQRHMDPAHGGGWFKLRMRIMDMDTPNAEESPRLKVWQELEDAGVEIQEFWCPHCRKEVTMSPRQVAYHLGNHPGALKTNFEPQTLCMTLSYQRPDQGENDDLYYNEADE